MNKLCINIHWTLKWKYEEILYNFYMEYFYWIYLSNIYSQYFIWIFLKNYKKKLLILVCNTLWEWSIFYTCSEVSNSADGRHLEIFGDSSTTVSLISNISFHLFLHINNNSPHIEWAFQVPTLPEISNFNGHVIIIMLVTMIHMQIFKTYA